MPRPVLLAPSRVRALPLGLVLSLAVACGPDHALRVVTTFDRADLAPHRELAPLAVTATASYDGETVDIETVVLCGGGGDVTVEHQRLDPARCAVPDEVTVEVSDATLDPDVDCEELAPVASTTPLDPPLVGTWRAADHPDVACEPDDDDLETVLVRLDF